MLRAWDELGVPARHAACTCSCRNEVPHGRGLGSSATAIVTGIVAAQALHDVCRGVDRPSRPRLRQRPRGAARRPPRQLVGLGLRRAHPLLVGLARRGHPHPAAPAAPRGARPGARPGDAALHRQGPVGAADPDPARRRRPELGPRRPARPGADQPPGIPARRRPASGCTRRRGATRSPRRWTLVDALRERRARGGDLGRRAVGAGAHATATSPRPCRPSPVGDAWRVLDPGVPATGAQVRHLTGSDTVTEHIWAHGTDATTNGVTLGAHSQPMPPLAHPAANCTHHMSAAFVLPRLPVLHVAPSVSTLTQAPVRDLITGRERGGRILRDRHHHSRHCGYAGREAAPLRRAEHHEGGRAPGPGRQHGHHRHRQDAQG